MTAEIYEFDLRNVLIIVPPINKQKDIAKKYLGNIKKYFEIEKEIIATKDILSNIEKEIN